MFPLQNFVRQGFYAQIVARSKKRLGIYSIKTSESFLLKEIFFYHFFH